MSVISVGELFCFRDLVPRSPIYPVLVRTDTRIKLGCRKRSMEGKTFLHARHHRLVNVRRLAELPFTFRTFRRREVPQPRLAPHDLTRARDLESFGRGLLGLATCDGLRHGADKLASSFEMAIPLCGMSEGLRFTRITLQ